MIGRTWFVLSANVRVVVVLIVGAVCLDEFEAMGQIVVVHSEGRFIVR